MTKLNRLFLLLTVIIPTVGCDQISKNVAYQNLRGMMPHSYFNNMFRFEYAENPGAFLSLGSNFSPEFRFWLLTVLVGAFLAGVLLYAIFNSEMKKFGVFGIALVLGGGIGNLIDRMFNPGGHVIDFMNMGVGQLRTGIFNVADVMIMAGILLLIINSIEILRKDAPHKEKEWDYA
jgi:signal peptidase II